MTDGNEAAKQRRHGKAVCTEETVSKSPVMERQHAWHGLKPFEGQKGGQRGRSTL